MEVNMQDYTECCSCFYMQDNNEVIFYDEIKDRVIRKQKVSDKQDADNVMRIWRDNAPEGVTCQFLN